MPMEYTPTNIAKMFARLNAEASKKGYTAMTRLALAVEKQAKLNLSYAPHKLGTPTPAVPGKGPGLISGTGRRSITHSPVVPAGLTSWQCRVGTAVGFVPPYSKTPSSTYLKHLETGDTRNGNAYPFLGPAVKFGQRIAGPVIYRDVFGRWPRVD